MPEASAERVLSLGIRLERRAFTELDGEGARGAARVGMVGVIAFSGGGVNETPVLGLGVGLGCSSGGWFSSIGIES
jgi:hypothetical protein